MSLQNVLEAKVKDKDTTATELKKIKLLSNLNFSTSYNLEADSLKLAPVRFNGATQIFDNKMSVNFSGGIDPYAIDNNGRRINTLNYEAGGGLARLTNASLNLSYSLNSDMFSKKKEAQEDKNQPNTADEYYRASSGGRTDDLMGFGFDSANQQPQRRDEGEEEEESYYNAVVPWDVRLAFATRYNNTNRQKRILQCFFNVLR